MAHLVSVVIPTYNRHVVFLSRSAESVLRQTWENLEVIVVDDNPPESPVREEIRRYIAGLSARDARVRYVENEKNVGGSIARNNGIRAARGEFTCFLDDDDEYLPDKVKMQLEYMLDGQYDMTFTATRAYTADGVMVDYREFSDLTGLDNETLLHEHLTRHITPTNAFMYRTDKLRQIGGFEDAKMGQEFYLMLKTIEQGLKIGYLHRCDVRMYRHNEGRISQGRNKITGEMALFEFKKRYFNRLSDAERNYIVFRHYVVMAVAYKRNRQFGRALVNLFHAFSSSPKVFFRESGVFLGNFLRHLGKK